jgi:hypothetical protein
MYVQSDHELGNSHILYLYSTYVLNFIGYILADHFGEADF